MNIQMLVLICSYILGIIANMIILPYLKKVKAGQVVRDDGPKSHLKKAGTPTMGGIAILISSLVMLAIAAFYYPMIGLVAIPFVGFGLIGMIDDIKKLKKSNTDGLSPIKKIILLFFVSSLFIILYLIVLNLGTDTLMPFLKQHILLSTGTFVIFTMFILIGTSNAINLTDGLDGLATGIVIIIMGFFTVIAIKNNNQEMVIFGSTIIGTCSAFLLFNIQPAKMFLGDTGSLALGGAIASIAIILKMPMYLGVIALIPVIETISVALQVIYFKLTKGKRLFKMAPYHHHLELSGLKENTIVIIFWGITAALCILAYFI
ncbi:MAG: phospho-N-acetylmuramoyl-pentapeptide-transferase [Clostridia bacterium]|nr:phospho-N-acetylmuramoyl-pentapeptide-transferase [Clostridia bacterium]MDD4375463.1 phospho-N-acetylmuramoyl-pentapeptide-transferase [Clostridia bacterium]